MPTTSFAEMPRFLNILKSIVLAAILILSGGMYLQMSEAAAQASTRSAAGEITERPNILFIYTDDQAPWALGMTGHPQLETPNIDRIAQEGAYLPNSFATTPVCSPSRASLLTSRYGTELGITEWISTVREPDHGLPPATVTWVERLQDAGYNTGLVGKWHLGVIDRYHPTRMGYDYFMGFRTGGLQPDDPILEKNGVRQPFDGYIGDILTDHAAAFIREHQDGDEPFMLSLHYRAPHRPWRPMPEEDWQPYESIDPELPDPEYPDLDVDSVKTMMRQYLASTASVDRNVGRLLDLLEELNLQENTVVVFTSDHGYNMGHNGIWHKGNGFWITHTPPPAQNNVPRGNRPNMYDAALRIPTAVRWPGEIEAGLVIDETISNLDWYPTLLSIAKLQPRGDKVIRGRNMLPLLKGEAVENWDNGFYAEYSTHHRTHTHMRVYRTPHWKLVLDFLNPERHELYDLQNDPGETTNLFDRSDPQIQQVIERLRGKILERMQEIDDPVAGLAGGPPFQGKVKERDE